MPEPTLLPPETAARRPCRPLAAGPIRNGKSYTATRNPDPTVRRPDGSVLDPRPSLAIRNHSPDGFEWGYRGSGPSQLALAILLDRTGDAGTALRLYQRFKDSFVALQERGRGWALSIRDLDAWIEMYARRKPTS